MVLRIMQIEENMKYLPRIKAEVNKILRDLHNFTSYEKRIQ